MKNEPSALERNKAVSDTPPMLEEILDLAPALETRWAAERATLPPGTILNDGADAEGDEGEGDAGADADAGGGEGNGEEESFLDSFDLEEIDPVARPAVESLQKEWQGQYTKRRQADRQELAEVTRTAEQSQALIEGLRDPTTMPHYLRLMGIDLSDPKTAELLGLKGAGEGEDQELLDLLDDENDVETRIEKLERERTEEGEAREAADYEQALDNLADQELEKIEGAWGRELDEDEDAFVRHRAEANPGPDGFPDYEAAAAVLKGFLARREKEFAKKRSEPGRGAPGGKPGGKALDPNNDEDRLALGTAAAERAMASQEE